MPIPTTRKTRIPAYFTWHFKFNTSNKASILMAIIKSLIGLITPMYLPVLSFSNMPSIGIGEKLSDLQVFLRDLLECPVCFGTIESVPVYQCQNGHITGCRDCISKLDKCPICRNANIKIRNLQLEKVVERLGG